MKKLLLFLLTTAMSATIYANSNKTEKVNLIPTKVGTKSEAKIPDVEYDPCNKGLSIKFKSDNGYILSIIDDEGNSLIRQSIATSGERTNYSLSPLSDGTYTINITSKENEYSGDLEIK